LLNKSKDPYGVKWGASNEMSGGRQKINGLKYGGKGPHAPSRKDKGKHKRKGNSRTVCKILKGEKIHRQSVKNNGNTGRKTLTKRTYNHGKRKNDCCVRKKSKGAQKIQKKRLTTRRNLHGQTKTKKTGNFEITKKRHFGIGQTLKKGETENRRGQPLKK